MIGLFCLWTDNITQQCSWKIYVLNNILGPKDGAVDKTQIPALKVDLYFSRGRQMINKINKQSLLTEKNKRPFKGRGTKHLFRSKERVAIPEALTGQEPK